MIEIAAERPTSDEDGFGLVEIVVSMFMLALLALAMLPLLVQSVKQSSATATLTTATQLVQQQMETAGQATNCAGLLSSTTAVTTTPTNTTDSRGVALLVSREVGKCPIVGAVQYGTVKVTVSVKRVDTNATLATASTLVYVSAS